ncbi:response regulator transcription factor [Alicyclobacillus dauci]|uniref:Response regulator transcription factor n=2 Tax=Alicyclobacillus dauci TaxID=1475485 RepID=A0ABY6Z8Q4_9BACL|nr:response regulator transcription factor [Alicyclobacillus dauci]
MVIESHVWTAAQQGKFGRRRDRLPIDGNINSVDDGCPEAKEAGTEASELLVEPLTDRERDVIQWMAKGLSNKEIGAQLGISEKTVKVHVSHILAKLNVFDRTQAVLFAVKMKMIDLNASDE